MNETGIQKYFHSVLQELVRIAQGFDKGWQDVSNFRALDDRTNILNSLEGCFMDLFMSITEDLSNTFNDMREET
jgi:hypothetical protein